MKNKKVFVFTLSAVSQALVQKIETEKDNTTIVVRISQQQEGNNNYSYQQNREIDIQFLS